jgi:hypothetical protein
MSCEELPKAVLQMWALSGGSLKPKEPATAKSCLNQGKIARFPFEHKKLVESKNVQIK